MAIKRFYKSFSFRLALLCMVVCFVLLVFLRASIYFAVINEAENDVKSIIRDQAYEIHNAFINRGVQYGLNVISYTLHNDRDRMFTIIYMDKSGKILEGNSDTWPVFANPQNKWKEFLIEDERSDQRGQYLGLVLAYPDGGKLLVSYSQKHVLRIRQIILNVMYQNLIYSILVAVFCSFIITYIIRRRLRVLNDTCRDIMQGKLDERVKLNNSGDEFDRLGFNFNSMLTLINRLINNIKETTDNLAHDMRTPLNRHRIFLEKMITDPETDEATREQLKTAVVEVDRIVEMFNSILNISRAEGKAIEDAEPFSLRELADDLLDLYMPLAEQKNIAIEQIFPQEIMFKGDRQLLAQSIMNLLDNAVKYTPDNGHITFTIQSNDENTEIIIADNGEGIPEEYYEKVRERFFRLEKSRTTEGSGLGLSLVEAVVKLHNGQMTLSDNKPGLIVHLTFPKD